MPDALRFERRARYVVRKLNAARVPVVAIPLVSYEDGYYFTPENVPRATQAYDAWRAWTAEHGLVCEDVGLDIEPEARIYERLMARYCICRSRSRRS